MKPVLDTFAPFLARNYPLQISCLLNKYFLLRHGESETNEQGIIVSDPENGTKGYGLTARGAEQVRIVVQEAYDNDILDSATIIYTSDFKRAHETAQIAQLVLGCDPVKSTSKLRERFFGNWENTHQSNYERIWSEDEKDFCHKSGGVESGAEVLERTLALIYQLEEQYKEKKILLVSHGDPLRILQSYFLGRPLASWPQLPLLSFGEIAKLQLTLPINE